jgi:hypothetical protein
VAGPLAAGGGYASPVAFVDGLTAAMWAAAVVLGLGAIAAMAIPGRAHLLMYRETDSAADLACGGRRPRTSAKTPSAKRGREYPVIR